MKSIALFMSLWCLSMAVSSQNKTGLIIGNGTDIRTESFSKGTVIKTMHGIQPVEILEVSKEVDGKGKKGYCYTYPWVKVKWEGDSTGWVYGKQLYVYYPDEDFITPNSFFTFKDKNYQLRVFLNYSYPPWDAEGETGCDSYLPVFIYDMDSKKYYPVIDGRSKKGQTHITIAYTYISREKITEIKSDASYIYVHTYTWHTWTESGVDYTLEWKNGKFRVASYVQGEDKARKID